MDPISQLYDAMGTLDVVLAVFGAIIFSMWFGHGKKLRGLISGALVGGLVKPLILLTIVGGAFVAAEQTQQKQQTPAQVDKTLKFWGAKGG